MNKIGFDVSEQEEDVQQEELGYVESQPVLAEEHWTDDLGDFFFQSAVRFCMVYGAFSALRDLLVLSFF
jgi:hypothetical protein